MHKRIKQLHDNQVYNFKHCIHLLGIKVPVHELKENEPRELYRSRPCSLILLMP